MESSRQDLSNDITEHKPTLKKNTKIRTTPVLVIHTQNRYIHTPPPKQMVCFYCEIVKKLPYSI